MKYISIEVDSVDLGVNYLDIGCSEIEDEIYDTILRTSEEFMAATKKLGPYIGFGLSNLFGTLTMAIG